MKANLIKMEINQLKDFINTIQMINIMENFLITKNMDMVKWILEIMTFMKDND